MNILAEYRQNLDILLQGLDLSGGDVPADLKALSEEYKEQRKAVRIFKT